jgi:cytochrome c2
MALLTQSFLGAVLTFTLPLLWLDFMFGRPFWELGANFQHVPAAIAFAHLAGAMVLAGPLRRRSDQWIVVGLTALLTTGMVCLAVVVFGLHTSRIVMAAAAALSVILFIVTFLTRGRSGLKLLAATVGLAVAVAGHTLIARGEFTDPKEMSASERPLGSSLYSLTLRSYKSVVPVQIQSGGALAKLWDDYLLATGDGRLYRLREDRANAVMASQPLRVRIPSNADAFRQAVAGFGLQDGWFRVADIHVVLGSDTLDLFASHHHWNASERCVTLRLSRISLDRTLAAAPAPAGEWRTLFETRPCLPVTLADGSHVFGGLQVGGRIASLSNGMLLLAVGDHEHDGTRRSTAYPQDQNASFGKVFSIDPVTGAAETYSIGHRNPQGLFVDSSDRVYETEHGPQGGDELNRLTRGANFGWPTVTYGVNYGSHDWPSNPRQGAHDGFAEPLFAWVPSIGISSVIGPNSQQFARWQGDLLVSSLRGQTIYRVRLANDRVVVTEPLNLGTQVRDLIEGHNGDLIVWSELGASPEVLVITADRTELSGGALFNLRCAGCHEIGDGKTHGIGPDLAGIVGAAAAARPAYNYSEPLKKLGFRWTEENLAAFLADAERVAPGNAMRVDAVADQHERRKIIEYLRSH